MFYPIGALMGLQSSCVAARAGMLLEEGSVMAQV